MVHDNTSYTGAAFIMWLIHLGFSYQVILILKTYLTDISAFVLGLIVMTVISAFVLKDTRIISDEYADPEDISVAELEKKGRKMVMLTATPALANRIPIVTAIILFIKVVMVRLLPCVKSMQVINKRSVRIWFAVMSVILIFVCFFFLTLDQHIILPNDHGGYLIQNITDKPLDK